MLNPTILLNIYAQNKNPLSIDIQGGGFNKETKKPY